jgi:hypothetical protein
MLSIRTPNRQAFLPFREGLCAIVRVIQVLPDLDLELPATHFERRQRRSPSCQRLGNRARFRTMSTLAEIESAVDALPRPEQETLLQHLARRLAAATHGPATDAQRRQRWLGELRQLRERNATGRKGAPLQQVMDELRADRA